MGLSRSGRRWKWIDAELRPSPGQLLPLADNGSKGEAGRPAGKPDDPPPVTDGFHYALLHKRVS